MSSLSFKSDKSVSVQYISSACNNTPHALDWNQKSGLIAFAAYCNVAVYDPMNGEGGKILFTLTNHKAKVISVKWVTDTGGNSVYEDIVSTSLDKMTILWKYVDDEYLPFHLRGHKDTVESIDAMRFTSNTSSCTLITSASADCTVKLWLQDHDNDEVKCIETITIPSKSYDLNVLCVRIIMLPTSSSNALILCSADDCKIYLYTLDLKTHQLTKINWTLGGHENWVRAMDFMFDENQNLFLACGSQDNTIRIWKISTERQSRAEGEFQTEEQTFEVDNKTFYINLESVLLGHEGWVYGVHWYPCSTSGTRPLKLLSCSMDKSIIVWSPDESSGIWLESARVGEVGGNTLGFYGCKFGPEGKFIIGHGFQGSLHLWSSNNDVWQPCITVGGHFGPVRDVQWEPSGQFFISVSEDQTTRLHAPFGETNHWYEMARPQVHGYDLTCLAPISTFVFASGADEKVIRVFKTTVNFVDNIQRLCNLNFSQDPFVIDELINCPAGAHVPALGLSNMAVESSESELQSSEQSSQMFHLTQPPTEEDLVQNTLWPEIQKLYGHGFEIYSLASSHDGKLLASACKATKPEHATIILWDVATWKQIQSLSFHQLTITQLVFSPDDTRLLSVSRDRRWAIFEIDNTKSNVHFNLVASSDKTNGVHKRIIWSCAWTHDSKYFTTTSRDGLCVLWGQSDQENGSLGNYSAVSKLELKEESFTAVALAPILVEEKYLVAIGTESGVIYLYTWSSKNKEWTAITTLSGRHAHQSVINRIQFRPFSPSRQEIIQFCSAGGDHFVKLYQLHLDNFRHD